MASPTEGTNESKITATWQANAEAWTDAVRGGQIRSRKEVTDAAVVDAVMSFAPRCVVDVGCGEGWLTRALVERGVRVVGFDAEPALVEAARVAGPGEYRVLCYDEVERGLADVEADVAVANFSLLGGDSVRTLLRGLACALPLKARLVIQTLHPVEACGGAPYEDGWREGSWVGCGEGFVDPAPWYFRTIGGWVALLRECGWRVEEIREPLWPSTRRPASMVFIGERASMQAERASVGPNVARR